MTRKAVLSGSGRASNGTSPAAYFIALPLLDEATQCILLYKSGGGYRFIHDLFRDYLTTSD